MATVALTANAATDGRMAEVMSLMDKAIGHFKSVGMEQVAKDFAGENGCYRQGELHVVIRNADGVVLAHAVNPKPNGKNLPGIKDTEDCAYVAAQILVRDGGVRGF